MNRSATNEAKTNDRMQQSMLPAIAVVCGAIVLTSVVIGVLNLDTPVSGSASGLLWFAGIAGTVLSLSGIALWIVGSRIKATTKNHSIDSDSININ